MTASAPRRSLTGRRAARLLLAAIIALASTAALADTGTMRASDWKAIRQVIAAQRAALIAGDRDRAFGYATPSLRAQFGDAESFMAMVHIGYPVLLTARYTEFLEGAVIDGLIIQPLRLVDADNNVRVALYTVEKQQGGAWRISGCRIGPSTVQAASVAFTVLARDAQQRFLESLRVACHVEQGRFAALTLQSRRQGLQTRTIAG